MSLTRAAIEKNRVTWTVLILLAGGSPVLRNGDPVMGDTNGLGSAWALAATTPASAMTNRSARAA